MAMEHSRGSFMGKEVESGAKIDAYLKILDDKEKFPSRVKVGGIVAHDRVIAGTPRVTSENVRELNPKTIAVKLYLKESATEKDMDMAMDVLRYGLAEHLNMATTGYSSGIVEEDGIEYDSIKGNVPSDGYVIREFSKKRRSNNIFSSIFSRWNKVDNSSSNKNLIVFRAEDDEIIFDFPYDSMDAKKLVVKLAEKGFPYPERIHRPDKNQ